MIIIRNQDNVIAELLNFFPVVVLTGARQTGKTTLLHSFLKDFKYATLDLPSVASLAENNPEEFFKQYSPPVLVDEVQYAPSLFRYLKVLVDSNRHLMGQFVLTGSQKFSLMQNVSESLAGRAVILELEGLSWQESKGLDGINELTYTVRGGFPELSRVPELPLNSWFSSYVATYLERDVRQVLNVSSLRDFEKFMRILASRNGQQIDNAIISRDLGISAKTVASWISILKDSGQISFLPAWTVNMGKRLVKTPKIYYNDTGLLCWLLGVTEENYSTSPFKGVIRETLVYSELRKAIKNGNLNRKLYFYRDANNLEVDFILTGNGFKMIEVKSSENPRAEDVQNVAKLARICSESGLPDVYGMQAFVCGNVKNRFPLRIPTRNKKYEIMATVCGLPDLAALTE
ncbi:MAG: ATP-binding protein [Treponema sp.]